MAATAPAQRPGDARDFAPFNAWLERYLAASPSERVALLAEGRALAAERRLALARMIRDNPQAALANAVPMVVRQQLPKEIADLLEERVNARGFYGVIGVVGAAADSAPIRRQLTLEDGERYDAFVFGRRVTQPTTSSINANGIALDGALALDERPLRVLEEGEIPVTTATPVETCVISGRSTAVSRAGSALPAITAETPAVQVGGVIHYLCSGAHVLVFEEQLVAAEGASGGAIKPTGSVPTNGVSTGVRSLLFIRLAFPDNNRELLTEAGAYDMMRQVNDWFASSSFGNVYFVTTVTPVIVLPRTEASYIAADEFIMRTDALNAARAAGYDYTAYDLDIIAYSGGPGGFSGQAYVGARGQWIKSTSYGVTCHELGHNLGVWHANRWTTTAPSIIGNGSNTEYGNSFDTMGSASAGDLQFNAYFKATLGWMPTTQFVHRVTTSGTYRIYAFDQGSLDPARRYALYVNKDVRDYWAEYRQLPLSGNAWTPHGALLNWSPWVTSNGGTQLLDMTPGSPDGTSDSALLIGRTFSDFSAGIHITPVGKGGTTPESLDMVVNLGTFPGNVAPTLSLGASATTAATGVAVNFTATASDANGDALSYAWDFGDKTFSTTNSAAVAKSWAAAGDYAVRCVVSDMKGGTASSTIVVRVGSPATFRVSGTVTLGGQPLQHVHVHNGLTGTSYRGAFTNSNGTYTLTNLAAGSTTVTAVLEGCSFATSGFSSPLALAGDVSGANFLATDTGSVSITATDADASETAGNPGQFTITRSGSTAAALTVQLFVTTSGGGSASRGSDYTLSPDPVASGSFIAVTIPAGSASLNIALNPIDDATQEGPETATLTLAPSSAYAIGGPGAATVTIQDNDTTKPIVRLAQGTPNAIENGAAGSFVLTRTGDTSSALTAVLTIAGTATNGTDYVTIPSSIVIPAGAASVTVPVTAINDALAEGTETVIINLASDTNYLRSFVNNELTQTVNLLDDDLATVSDLATDAAANEAGADPGVFTITRTGPLDAPLTVNYAMGGRALQNVDYLPVTGVLQIPAGAASGTVTIIPVDDAVGEPAETVILQLRGGLGYVTQGSAQATVTITDNSDLPYVTIGVQDGTCAEPSDAGTFRVTTSGTGASNVTIKYTVSGTATPGVDYTTLGGTLTMGRNTTSTITVTPLDDALLENAESITVTLTPDPAYALALDSSATIYLADNDQPMVSINATDSSLGEGGNNGTFTVSRATTGAAPLDVFYTTGGTATNGTDYATLTGVATIPTGALSTSVTITPTDDAVLEGTETIQLAIAPGSYGVAVGNLTLYLADNDTPATQVRFSSASGGSSETAGTILIPVTLSAPAPAGGVSVEYGINGGSALPNLDYQFTPGVLTFAAGETAKNLSLTILDDYYREPSQTVVLRLLNATGATLGTSTYTHTITDDDTNTVTIAATTPNTGEFGAAPGGFTLTRLGGTAFPLSVTLTFSGTATNGADYATLGATWTIPAGQSSLAIPVTPLTDQLAEGNETVIATVFGESGYLVGAPSAATVTIADRPMDVWRLANFGAQANTPSIGGDLADPDQDGMVNLLEYSTGTNPLQFTAAPVVGTDVGVLTLTFTRLINAPDVSLSVQTTGDLLGSWSAAGGTEDILFDNGTTRTVRANVPLNGTSLQFLRLRATKL